MSHKVGCLYYGKNNETGIFLKHQVSEPRCGDANIIIVFNQLLQYTCHSNSSGLSPQDGEGKEHVTRVGHNLCKPHGLLPGFTSTYEF